MIPVMRKTKIGKQYTIYALKKKLNWVNGKCTSWRILPLVVRRALRLNILFLNNHS